MQISTKALALTAAVLWGGVMLVIGLMHLARPHYGNDFLGVMSSVYPGFYGSGTFTDVLVGTLYAFVDGGLAAFVFGSIYNFFAGRFGRPN